MPRCPWAEVSDLDRLYHDQEWGVPIRGDDHLAFEMLTLEGAQAGLSWSTVLAKREGYRRCFAGFDPAKVARFTDKRVEKLLADPAIIRHRGKIESTVGNARAVLDLQDAEGSLCDYLWSFVDGRPIQNRLKSIAEAPEHTPISTAMSKELKRRGFRFLGPTTCYAFMQAAGMVNDHLVSCPRHKVVKGLS
ncbi:DNA-3-methyladenine glycosylase 1 [Posidoniimonas polymericola]|uniref:DNA-3-methyladenine glycosylase 1 n=1 Tax=Posidoniimonas polymericola TaxID=2528002 RepID=A0A5C5YST9_9BACT|nr:DNA-3-methyladenine glycosylase I [Posidoniimonas polymericola]TWT77946.1 DNA-3-methyladenine glycosylase 1 [Posidoniimonas polymericola]